MLNSTNLVESAEIVDSKILKTTVKRFAEREIYLPTFAELADPSSITENKLVRLAGVDKNSADARNLWRVHWHNQLETASSPPASPAPASSPPVSPALAELPEHIVIPPEMSGVASPIAVVFGNRFPMIGAHKVLAAYACLVPRVVTGRFDPTRQRAIWPSTGNYARGGVAISNIMGCRGVAVLPENMSKERFAWLESWVENPDDIVRTPGSESNVKEIYDKCAELDTDPANVIFNQFSEFPNHLAHYEVTGKSLERVVRNILTANPPASSSQPQRLAAFISASGSAGTLGAGDYLKEQFGSLNVAVEALECPTMLYNGFGEHNIQGIGDKHIPLIHNVMNTDVAVAVSDIATDALFMAAGTSAGKQELEQRGVTSGVIESLRHFGLSSWCNLLAAIKTSKLLGLGEDDLLITVATDGSELYSSERPRLSDLRYGGEFTAADALQSLEQHLWGADTQDTEELGDVGRDRIFNLGYFTWVEQQGVSVEDFTARRNPDFWSELHSMAPVWDEAITDFNQRAGF